MTGMVVAQTGNTSTVTQEGDGDQATVNQTGNLNYMEYSVKGDENIFTASQDNSMKETQEGNWMHVDQYSWQQNQNIGNVITATQMGDENDLDALLKGDRNNITFYQDGARNQIKGFSPAPDESFTEEPFRLNSDDSYVSITQIGQDNLMRGDIQGNNQHVDVYQENGQPDDNVSEVFIRASWGNPAQQTVDIDQVGQNYSHAQIHGDGNAVTHNQYGNQEGSERGRNTAVTWIIDGEGNTSSIEQEGQNDAGYGFNYQNVTAPGDDPYYGAWAGAWHKIMGDNNTAITHQDGNDNKGVIIQSSDGNTARQVQDAWNGIAGEDDPNGEADNNQSWIYQHTGANDAYTFQFGDNNSARIIQNGDGNIAIGDQGIWDQERPAATGYAPAHGYGNTMNVSQTGNSNWSHVIQNGNGNTANVTQQQ